MTDKVEYIEAAVAGVIVACIYAPNGDPQPGPKFYYKLAWMKRLHKHAGKLLKANAPVVIASDSNVAPTPLGYLSDEIVGCAHTAGEPKGVRQID
jgi:exodeoxyribonuclease-3